MRRGCCWDLSDPEIVVYDSEPDPDVLNRTGRRASPPEPVKCSGASFGCHSTRQRSQSAEASGAGFPCRGVLKGPNSFFLLFGGVGGVGGGHLSLNPLWMVGVLDYIQNLQGCLLAPRAASHTLLCQRVSRAAGAPTVSVFLSRSAATWRVTAKFHGRS